MFFKKILIKVIAEANNFFFKNLLYIYIYIELKIKIKNKNKNKRLIMKRSNVQYLDITQGGARDFKI